MFGHLIVSLQIVFDLNSLFQLFGRSVGWEGEGGGGGWSGKKTIKLRYYAVFCKVFQVVVQRLPFVSPFQG